MLPGNAVTYIGAQWMPRQKVGGKGLLLMCDEFWVLVNHRIRISTTDFMNFYNCKTESLSPRRCLYHFYSGLLEYRETILFLFTHHLAHVVQQQISSWFFLLSLKYGLKHSHLRFLTIKYMSTCPGSLQLPWWECQPAPSSWPEQNSWWLYTSNSYRHIIRVQSSPELQVYCTCSVHPIPRCAVNPLSMVGVRPMAQAHSNRAVLAQ